MTSPARDDEELVRFSASAARAVGHDDDPSRRPPIPVPAQPACLPVSKGTRSVSVAPPTSDAFRAAHRTARPSDVPQRGWRRQLHRLTGVNLGPSGSERAERQSVERITAPITGPRHVLFANPKGGAGKTTTCLGVAATLGVHRGGGVVAFDNNPTRGTLGLRAQSSGHSRTVRDLLTGISAVRQVGDLAAYTRAQVDGHFDVLASDEDPQLAVARGRDDYVAVMSVLDTFYKLVCVDTGNDVTAPVFTAAVSGADQLVVVTGASWDSAYSASWLLDHLEGQGGDALVRRAVTVVTLPRGRSRDLAAVDDHFRARTRAVLHVPFDPALDAGSEVQLDRLHPRTRRAWLDVTAAIADGFSTPSPARTATAPQEDL